MASGDSTTVDGALRVVEATPDRSADSGAVSLVARAKAGDRVALEDLARAELPRVERLLFRILGPRGDMEDLVQIVFLETCRALPAFRGDSAFSTFVGGITVRVARRAMRPTAWQRMRASDPGETPRSTDHPDQNAIAAEQIRRLRSALEAMTAPKRIAFVLWALDGMDVKAIAATTGASVAATRSRIFYAQQELRSRAREDPYLRDLLEDRDAG